MKQLLIIVFALVTVSSFGQAKKPAGAAAKPAAKTSTATTNPFKNEVDSVSYSIGLLVAQNLKAQGFDKLNVALFQKAVTDATQNKKPLLTEDAVKNCVMGYQQKVQGAKQAEMAKENAAKGAVARKEGAAFLAENAKRPGVITTPYGWQYEVIKAGTEDTKPKLTDKVKVHYHGTLINGTIFDSSVDRGEPIVYPVNGFITGWQQALQMMTVGSKWKLYVPADLAYGDNPPGTSIPPGSTLVFEMELLGLAN
ncbi:FKBP-type peptidyl-prolyl cis-trans isomerase [Sediminibacterium roseum]|uniref:Peptidyl-prolyl cis-trans isomerase n=1 Tax=Sediminibacterium roseum TaxID=1978412 RepID=A0ABW9ZUN8_9BACT|nr:FKBP-type peptidyl-prolyl cis-trans isomerase [Sediminibacterium roseum]NCI48576.1 FKBP-type peptidyl-prolyl cis-trans isomerase [Sediminibacterium roseum]